MRVGLIVEGATDAAVLEALVQDRCPTVSVTVLQPKGDRIPSGKSGIEQYLGEKGRALDNLLRFGGFCRVLVQADADIAGQPCHQDAAQQWQQTEAKLLAWSKRQAWPPGVHPVIPVMCLETWICASQSVCQNRRPAMECFSLETIVSNMSNNAMQNAMRQKNTHFYRQTFAPDLTANWRQVVQFCPQGAGRFDQVLNAVQQACCP